MSHCPFWNPLQNLSPHIGGWKIPNKKILQPIKTCHNLSQTAVFTRIPSKMQISTSAWPLKPGKQLAALALKKKWIKKKHGIFIYFMFSDLYTYSS